MVITALTITVYAQSPQKMSYQGVVRNSAGALVTSHAVGMKISILQGSATGTVVFSETYSPNPQTNANGLVTVEIGGGTASVGTFAGIDWTAGPYFLKTETDPAGSVNYTISGTSQLLSVPYALYAKTAANGFSGAWADLTGKPAFATVATSGSYNDLLNRPTLFSGSYNDLTNKPALFNGTWSSLTGKPTTLAGYGITDADGSITNEIQLLSLSGSLLTLSNGGGTVTLPSSGGGDNWGTQTVVTNTTLTGAGTTSSPLAVANAVITPTWANIQGKPVFSAVAISGAFADLLSKPTTLVGYGITDAVTITGNQTITGIKTFSNDLSVNGLIIGKGNNAVSSNTAIGNGALHSNTTGYVNTAIGNSALSANTNGYGNTANGYRALYYNTEGFLNTANGYHALYSNTAGSENTANGYGALMDNTTGDNNTANGNRSLYNNTEGWNNTAIGNEALYSNTTGYVNTAIGSGALWANTEGRNNTAIGSRALHLNTTGDFNTAIGNLAGVASGNLTNANAIGTSAIVNASNKVRIGNSSVTVIEGQVNWSVGSDRRLKENIDYSDKLGLEFVNGLETATFTYKDDPAKRHHDGLIAQDVNNVLDKSGLTFSGLVESDNEEKTFNLSYAEFVIPLINSVKELNNKSRGQQNRIEDLQKEINELKSLVNSLLANQGVQSHKQGGQ